MAESVATTTGSITGRQVMRQEEPVRGGPLGAVTTLHQIIPFEAAASDRPGRAGLEAARYHTAPTSDLLLPALTHHRIFHSDWPPEELDLMSEGVKRHAPPPPGRSR